MDMCGRAQVSVQLGATRPAVSTRRPLSPSWVSAASASPQTEAA
jgi:hypothetical protein